MADKRCDNGHFIDESWDLCPYCPQDAAEPEIPIVKPRTSTAEMARPVAAPASVGAPASGVFASSPAAVAAPASVSRREAVPPPRDGGSLLSSTKPPSSSGTVERTIAVRSIDPSAAAKRYVVGWLVGLSGSSRGESYAVRMGRNVLGRDRRSDIVVNDDQASSHHADLVFRPEERRFILMDHNSTNGTYVNESEIEPRRDLNGNDVIRIGAQRYLFMPLCHDGFYWDDEGALK